MSTSSKLGIVAFLGVIGGGAAFVSVSLSNGSSLDSWTSLNKEGGYTDNSKVGKAFGSFLVGVNGNEEWWKGSYDTYLKDQGIGFITFSADFAKEKVKDAFSKSTTSSSSSKSLNLICKDVYEKTLKEGVRMVGGFYDGTSYINEKLREDFWRYCSPLGTAPESVKDVGDSNYEDNTIGKLKKNELLSTWGNENLWNIKERDFFNLSEESITSPFFKKFYKEEKNKTSRKTLRDLCEEAYKKQPETSSSNTDNTKVSAEDVVKYCSLEDRSN